MTKLQVIDARKMEKLLFKLGFERVIVKKEVMYFIGIQMGELQQFLIIVEVI